jgi:hypothetical protein
MSLLLLAFSDTLFKKLLGIKMLDQILQTFHDLVLSFAL